jgi:uncharacterized membrane protein
VAETTEGESGSGPLGAPEAPVTADDPQDALRKVQAELGELSVRLVLLAENVRTVSAALLSNPTGPAEGRPIPTDPRRFAPQPSPDRNGRPGGYAPPSHPRVYASTALDEPRPPTRAVVSAGRRPRPRISVAELFAVVGSAITLIGVTFVLVLPQDGVLGPFARVGIAVVLAAAAIAAAIWQHAKDARNLGAQALMATGIASAYLCVLAVTVLFERPDGRGLLSDAAGLTLAGLLSIGGLWIARRWDSQWLGVLAVLGSLVLAPFVVQSDLIWALGFMMLLTIVTAPFQLGRTWVALMAARVKPTAVIFFGAVAIEQPSLTANATVTLALAAVLAVAGLGMAVLHQHDTRPNRVASAIALVPMAAPAAAACWLADRPFSAVVCGVLGVLYGACGLLPGRFSPVLRSAAVPVGALFAGFALLRLTDGAYAGSISFGLAIAYFALAARSRFRPAFIVGLVAAGLGTLGWFWLLAATMFANLAAEQGTAGVAESLVGLAAVVVAAPALRTFGVPGSWRMSVTWLASAAFGSVAIVLAGAELGRLLGRSAVGFQTAHALVTVAWLVLCVVLLRLGLRPDRDGPVAVRLALILAVAAVAKLFLFDLATLPGLVRALAFIAVGVLLLVIGTWYYRQLDRVRRGPALPPP